jgi:hypothetical protein
VTDVAADGGGGGGCGTLVIRLGSDLDEIPSREFVTALKHCDVLPKVKPSRVGGSLHNGAAVVARRTSTYSSGFTWGAARVAHIHSVATDCWGAFAHTNTHQVEADPSADCSKLVVLTFGHKYYFDCSVLKPAGHYHPDVTYGRCVDKYTTEELRLGWGDWEPAKRDYYRCVSRRFRPSCRPCLAYVYLHFEG